MADTVRDIADLQVLLGDSAAAHSTNRQLIRDLLVSLEATVATVTVRGKNSAAVDTANVLAAAAEVCAEGVTTGYGVRLKLRGNFSITDTIPITQHRVHVDLGRKWETRVLFTPTSTKSLFKFQTTDNTVLYQCSFWGGGFQGSNAQTKTVLELVDTSEFSYGDIAVLGWTGLGNSQGVWYRGREMTSVGDQAIQADIPIRISINPNSPISCDHLNWWGSTYLLPIGSNPSITVDDGANLSNINLAGDQAWVGGSDGFKWIDTTATQSSQDLAIRNVRSEGLTSPTGNLVRIETSHTLNCLTLDNVKGALNALGVKLRNVANAALRDVRTHNTSGNSLDVDSTVQPLSLENCFFQTGGTVSVGTLKKVWESGKGTVGGATSFNCIYALPATIVAAHTEIPFMGPPHVIAQDATDVIGKADDTCGYVDIVTSENVMARFVLTGTTHTTGERDDTFGFFSATKDTAASYNVYYDAASGNYLIQNKRTGSKTVRWLVIGDKVP